MTSEFIVWGNSHRFLYFSHYSIFSLWQCRCASVTPGAEAAHGPRTSYPGFFQAWFSLPFGFRALCCCVFRLRALKHVQPTHDPVGGMLGGLCFCRWFDLFLVLSQDFHLAADITRLSRLLSASAIAALSVFITVLNSWSHDSSPPACLLLVLVGNLETVLFAFWGALCFPTSRT